MLPVLCFTAEEGETRRLRDVLMSPSDPVAGPRGDSSLIPDLALFVLPWRRQELIANPVTPLTPCFSVVSEPEANH